jgi:hypothetical protein
MNKLTLSLQQMQDIFEGDEDEELKSDGLTIKIIEESEWTQDHKYQYMYKIIEVGGKFYSVDFDRSGSPFTDWYYGFQESGHKSFECLEAEKVEVTTYEWRTVK